MLIAVSMCWACRSKITYKLRFGGAVPAARIFGPK